MFIMFQKLIPKSEKPTSQIQTTTCYMTLHAHGNSSFPIKSLLNGAWNERMKTGTKKHLIYATQDEAMQASVGSTRPGIDNGAYILEVGYSPEQATLLIKNGQFNKIVRKATNYINLAKNKINPETFNNEQFDSALLSKALNLIK